MAPGEIKIGKGCISLFWPDAQILLEVSLGFLQEHIRGRP
jgi:hypothetical protein